MFDGVPLDQNINLCMLLDCNIDDDMSDISINSNQTEIKRGIDFIEMVFGSQSPSKSIENNNYEDQTNLVALEWKRINNN
jgi:hypothetical protein